MRSVSVVLAGVVLVSAAAVAARPGQFRSSVDIVPVYVSVRSGGSFVQNLEAKDFELTDNGVRQEVESVLSDAVPIDVTLVVDTSNSVINSLAAFKSDVSRIAALLRPEEQMRLVTFDTDVREILPMQPPPSRPPVSEIRLGDATSLNDALLFSMARAPRQDRRHLVFVFTDGYDTSSLLGYGALPEIASRADALLHIVLVRPNVMPTARSSRDFALLSEAAVRTGGATNSPRGKDDIVESFQEAIQAFRRSYVVSFNPKDVKNEGWHTLGVKILKQGDFDIRARQGYYAR